MLGTLDTEATFGRCCPCWYLEIAPRVGDGSKGVFWQRSIWPFDYAEHVRVDKGIAVKETKTTWNSMLVKADGGIGEIEEWYIES